MSSPPESTAPPGRGAGKSERLLAGLEWTVSLGLLACCLFLNWTFLRHAGGYWRDEANSVQLASWPGVSENWRAVWLDAHPVGYALLLKPFLLGGLDHVAWLRWLGFAMAVLIFGTIWGIAYDITRRPPTAVFALIALNHYEVRFLGSLRPYGFATWLLLLLFWRWYRFAQPETDGKKSEIPWDCLLLGALVVNFLYASAVPVAVLGSGATLIVWRCRGRRAGMGSLLALALGLAPLVLYVPALARARYWAALQGYRAPTWGPLQGAISEVIETENTPLRWVWMALFGAVLPISIYMILRGSNRAKRAAIFWCLGGACLAGMAGLLYVGKTFTAAWYFVPALALFAVSGQIALGTLAEQNRGASWVAVVVAVLLAAVTVPRALPLLKLRQTNVDLMAAKLDGEVQAKDLVIVANPLFGVSFNLYYRGAAPWETIPPLSDHRIHRFDLIRRETGQPDVMTPLLRRTAQVLQNGGTLYLVGGVRYVEAKPDPARAFDFDVPLADWTNELAAMLGQHAGEAKTYRVEGDLPMMPLEQPPLIVVRGWR